MSKKQLLAIIFSFNLCQIVACTCYGAKNFIDAYRSNYSELIIKAKVLCHKYSVSNITGTTYENTKNIESDTVMRNNEIYIQKKHYLESIIIEVIEVICGIENKKEIEILGPLGGGDCNASVERYITGNTYIFSISSIHDDMIRESKIYKNHPKFYWIGGCNENSLEYDTKNQSVKGYFNQKYWMQKRVKSSIKYNALLDSLQ